mmetsp:Transcript_14173/g.36732  ORF Transcript_14173/g.36732 Transcript_14173/m.36732 type:complete len:208 (+) Transcript_14173:1237-1860(+)
MVRPGSTRRVNAPPPAARFATLAARQRAAWASVSRASSASRRALAMRSGKTRRRKRSPRSGSCSRPGWARREAPRSKSKAEQLVRVAAPPAVAQLPATPMPTPMMRPHCSVRWPSRSRTWRAHTIAVVEARRRTVRRGRQRRFPLPPAAHAMCYSETLLPPIRRRRRRRHRRHRRHSRRRVEVAACHLLRRSRRLHRCRVLLPSNHW